MLFFLGFIGGIGISLVVFLGFIYLSIKKGNVMQKAVENVEKKARPKVKIIMPPTEAEEAQQEIVERNKREGLDTRAEDLGL